MLVLLVVALFGSAVASRLVGHDGTTPFIYAAGDNARPVGPWTHVPAPANARFGGYGNLLPAPKGTKRELFVLGADGPIGRDELIRLLDGLRTSLEIALGAIVVALAIAVPVGAAAGYFGGAVDAVVSQLTETFMAFPLLLFLLFANRYLVGDFRSLGWSWVVPDGAAAEAVLIGVFTAFYPIRLIRAQLFVLRHAEFVDAAHMVGASNWRILRRHLLPHLAPILLSGGRRGRHEHPRRGGPELPRDRRPGVDTEPRLAAVRDLGDDLQHRPVQQPPAHAVADGVPDGVDRHHRRLAQPPLRRHPPRDRTERHAAVRAARYFRGALRVGS